MMGYFALTYTLHIHQSLNEIEKLQKSLQKGGWSLAVAWAGAGPATWHIWSRLGSEMHPGIVRGSLNYH